MKLFVSTAEDEMICEYNRAQWIIHICLSNDFVVADFIHSLNHAMKHP